MKQKLVSAIGIGIFAALFSLARSNAVLAADATPKLALPTAVSSADLAAMSGGASAAVSNQTLTALNAGNSVNADSLVTGNVTLQTGAFNGFNGIGNFVFNTGNNNNVQGTLSVTIVTPP